MPSMAIHIARKAPHPLVLALCLLALATNTLSETNNARPPQHHHEPILSGALFPDALPTQRVTAKEPCPTGCVEHKSGIYLAVTSIGDGFPRVQFTCTGPQHSQPTAQACNQGLEQGQKNDYPAQQKGRGRGLDVAGVDQQDHVHDPAEPTPEPTPLAHHGCRQELEGSATDYTITPCSQHSEGSPHSHTENKGSRSESEYEHRSAFADYMDYGHTGAEYYQQQHDGFIFSPRERASAETELHTTTLTYSDDPHPTPKSIHYTNKGFPHQQHSHHRYNPHQQQKQQHAGSVSVSEDRTQASSRDEAIMPEPMVSILQPTPVADSVRSSAHDPSGRLHLQTEEQKAGPPPPVPEPTPEHTIAGSDMLHRRDHDAEQLHSHKQHPPAGLRSDDGHGHGHPGEVDAQENRRKRTVRRVTTLIIETQTIIGPPRATMPAHLKAESRTKPSRSLGDHPMFDAGVEGDMVASIVHSEQGLRQEHDPPRRHVERNKEKKPATLK